MQLWGKSHASSTSQTQDVSEPIVSFNMIGTASLRTTVEIVAKDVEDGVT